MKRITTLIIAALTMLLLCSFMKPEKVQRRKGLLNMNENGKVIFTPLEDFKDYTPNNDTVYQYKVN